MPTDIVITAENIRLEGTLNDTPTAQALAEALPIEGQAQRWGDEIYFPVPQVVHELDDTAATVVQVGDMGYWPPSRALCLFFGLTPSSLPGEIRPASAVEIFGRLIGDPAVFKTVEDGEPIVIEKA